MLKEKRKSLSRVPLCDPADGNLLGSSVHGILQARILEWVAILFSRGSSWSRDQIWVSCIADRLLTIWAIREATICTKCYFKYFININPSNSYSRSKNELLLLASFHRWRNSSRERLTSSRSHNEWKSQASNSGMPAPALCYFFFPFIFINWRLITLQYYSGFCHTLTWISHGFTCVPHHDPPSRLPLHPIPLGLPSTPGLSTCLMHPAWAGDLFHPW